MVLLVHLPLLLGLLLFVVAGRLAAAVLAIGLGGNRGRDGEGRNGQGGHGGQGQNLAHNRYLSLRLATAAESAGVACEDDEPGNLNRS